jgi:hypothetical protein
MKNKVLKETHVVIGMTIILFFASCKKEYRCRTCPDPNKPPVANAGKDTAIRLPVNSIVLDGSASSDDVFIMSYHWTKLAGPSSFEISNANVSQTVVAGLTEGQYIIELEVKDNSLRSGKDLLVIDVLP